MNHKDKNRDPMKARKRAKNDARTALRKLEEWARSVNYTPEADNLAAIADKVARIAIILEESST